MRTDTSQRAAHKWRVSSRHLHSLCIENNSAASPCVIASPRGAPVVGTSVTSGCNTWGELEQKCLSFHQVMLTFAVTARCPTQWNLGAKFSQSRASAYWNAGRAGPQSDRRTQASKLGLAALAGAALSSRARVPGSGVHTPSHWLLTCSPLSSPNFVDSGRKN